MNREQRIRKLELQVFGDDDETLMTWEEFQHVYCALCPEPAREQAKSNWRLQRILESPPTPNLDRLLRRWARMEATIVQQRAQELNATDTAAQPDSQSPSAPSPTCSSPVLTGGAAEERTTVAGTDKKEPAPSASPSQPAGDPTPAEPAMTQEVRQEFDRLFGKGRWKVIKTTTPNPTGQGMPHNPGRQFCPGAFFVSRRIPGETPLR